MKRGATGTAARLTNGVAAAGNPNESASFFVLASRTTSLTLDCHNGTVDETPFWPRKKDAPGPPPLPEFYVQVRDYALAVLEGAPTNETFEKTSLSENGFGSLGLIFVLLNAIGNSPAQAERLRKFLKIGIPPGPDPYLPLLLQRATILRESFDETQAYILLESGVVGDRREIHFLVSDFDNVDFVVKMARVAKGLENVTDFDDVE